MIKIISRKELYDQIWAEPMIHVAKKYGLSDRGMAKLCERNNIPVPPRGYWARIQAGQKLKQVPLPSKSSVNSDTIRIYGGNPVPEEIKSAMKKARTRQGVNEMHDNLVEQNTIETVHKTIEATAKTLRKAKSQSDGSIQATDSGHCGVIVRQDCLERAILILNKLAYALNEQGLTLQPTGKGIKVTNETDELEFSLVEKVRREKHVPTEEELAKEKQLQLKRKQRNWANPDWDAIFYSERAWPEFDYIRTGDLGIHITDQYIGGARRSWNDGKTQKIENMIDDIAAGTVAYLAGIRLQREQRERWHQEYEDSRKRQELTKRKAERETKRQEFVDQIVKKAEEIGRLKQFLSNNPNSKSGNDEFSRMAEWIGQRIEHLEIQLQKEQIILGLQKENLFPVDDEQIYLHI